MNKILKIVGTVVVCDIIGEAIYAMGKGHMLANVRKFDPDTADEIHDAIDDGVHNPDIDIDIFHRFYGMITNKTDDFVTEVYKNRKKK